MSVGTELLVLGLLSLILVYPYLIYPAVLQCLAWHRLRMTPIGGSVEELARSTASILIAAHNEEDAIAATVENLLNQECPEDGLEVIVVSDGSTDRTVEVVRAFKDPRVTLLTQERAGKTAALNAAAEVAFGDIYIFTDANTIFLPGAVKQLVRRFADDRVGLVTGQAVGDEAGTNVGLYHRYEHYLKSLEGRLGTVAGADGAIYALRAALWRPLDHAVINDFFHPIQMALSGARAEFASGAKAVEPSSGDLAQEFARQQRIVAQSFGLYCWNLLPLLRRGRLFSLWVVTSHRTVRWFHSPVMAAFLILLAYFGWINSLVWMHIPVFGYPVALGLGRWWTSGLAGRGFRLFYEFEYVHWAYFCGVLDLVRGRTHVTWNPRAGSPDNA